MTDLALRTAQATRATQIGLLANAALAMTKLFAGLLGHSYALIADAVESISDVFSSLVVWGGLRVASREADEEFPFGYGKAEPIAAAVVALMLVGAAIGIAVEAVREIRTPHHTPAPFTLLVLGFVVFAKWGLSRWVTRVARSVGSTAVHTDAWHHMSDAITSLAAGIGIVLALIGGPGWESADDWAALVASGIILWNAQLLLRPAIGDLMDRAPAGDIVQRIRATAESTPGVRAIEKLHIRRTGLTYLVYVHVQADPQLSLRDAHALGGLVRHRLRTEVAAVSDALVHMEPFEA